MIVSIASLLSTVSFAENSSFSSTSDAISLKNIPLDEKTLGLPKDNCLTLTPADLNDIAEKGSVSKNKFKIKTAMKLDDFKKEISTPAEATNTFSSSAKPTYTMEIINNLDHKSGGVRATCTYKTKNGQFLVYYDLGILGTVLNVENTSSYPALFSARKSRGGITPANNTFPTQELAAGQKVTLSFLQPMLTKVAKVDIQSPFSVYAQLKTTDDKTIKADLIRPAIGWGTHIKTGGVFAVTISEVPDPYSRAPGVKIKTQSIAKEIK